MINIPEGLDYDEYVELLGSLESQDLKSSGHWRDDYELVIFLYDGSRQ